MKAILLAAGVGQRMGPITESVPKCLIPLGGQTVLARFLDSLVACGVEETVMVVGHLREKIRETVGTGYKGMPIRTIDNDDYHLGSVLSLWAAREELHGDLLIMDADVLFHRDLLRRLIDSPQPNCLLLDASAKATGEEMMLTARDRRIVQIARTVEPPYDNCGEGVGFLKLNDTGARTLHTCLETFLQTDSHNRSEYEQVYNDHLFAALRVGYEEVGPLPWTELDFPADLKHAENTILGGDGPTPT